MTTSQRCFVLLGLILTAWPVFAGPQPVRIDLASETTDPGLEYFLEMGTVLLNGAPSTDMAICLTRARITPNGILHEPTGRLVAFIDADKNGIEAIVSMNGQCTGPDCGEVLIRTTDHNIEIDPAPLKRVCTDPYGIGRAFGFVEVQLGELRPETQGEVDLTLYNTYDEARTFFRVGPLGLTQTCRIPATDIHIRYGRNWFADSWSPRPWMQGNSLYVCSEGVRVCTFSDDFMTNKFHQAVITANDQHNTVIHASNSTGYYGGHECGLARDAHGGFLGRYFIEGWRSEWQIGLRINAGQGNDWVLGSPEPDLIVGGEGDDLLRGMAGGSNRIYGERGNDIMHDSPDGVCDGGLPKVDTLCAVDPWDWPNDYPAGDCCCDGCSGLPISCVLSDLTPGVAEVPPDPW